MELSKNQRPFFKPFYYPQQENTWLGGRYTIIFNDELFAGLWCLLLIADFAGRRPVRISGDKPVHFYTLAPPYAVEHDFERQHDVHQLLRQFDQSTSPGCWTCRGPTWPRSNGDMNDSPPDEP